MGNNHVKLGCMSAAVDVEEQRQRKASRNTAAGRHPNEYSLVSSSHPSASRSSSSLSTTTESTISPSSSPAPGPQHGAAGGLEDEYGDESAFDLMQYGYYNRPNVKLLFLDVDGVLNNPSTPWDEYHNGIDDKLLKYLKLVLLKTGCKIVLSTTWRLNENAKRILLHSMKSRADINTDDVVIGQTVSMKGIRGKHRSNEIQHYLARHQHRFNVISWCALDDLPLSSYDPQSERLMNGHFVRTNPNIGISPENALRCIDLLNANDHEYNPYAYHPQTHCYYT